jgi:hypothetical protein
VRLVSAFAPVPPENRRSHDRYAHHPGHFPNGSLPRPDARACCMSGGSRPPRSRRPCRPGGRASGASGCARGDRATGTNRPSRGAHGRRLYARKLLLRRRLHMCQRGDARFPRVFTLYCNVRDGVLLRKLRDRKLPWRRVPDQSRSMLRLPTLTADVLWGMRSCVPTGQSTRTFSPQASPAYGPPVISDVRGH